jgi:hypothetical protein
LSWQNSELGLQTWVLQLPCEHTRRELAQSMPPVRKPEPSLLHVVAIALSHQGWFGEQIWFLQLPDAPSQYCVEPQVLTRKYESPLALHWRSSSPEQ